MYQLRKHVTSKVPGTWYASWAETFAMASSSGVVDALTLLQDELLRHAQAIEEYVCNYVGAHTPRHHTPKTRNDKNALVLVDDMLCQLRKAQDAMNLSLNRAQGKLCRFRNWFINLNSLPDELLLSILQHASGYDLEEKMNVIEVCGRWRDLCMAHPKFWADFHARPFPRNGIARAIRYSRTHPICVHINHEDEKKARKVVFANAQSIERLDVHVPDVSGQRKNVWLDRNWPVLRVLEFQMFNARVLDVVAPPMSGRADKLRALTLQDVRFPYSPQYYRNLRFLRLMSDCPDTHYRSSGARDGSFLDALRGSPNLEVLMLKDPPTSVDAVLLPRGAEAEAVHLPRVRLLKLVMSTQKASLVLRHLRTSPTALQSAEVITHRWRTELGADYGATDTRPIHDIDKTLLLELPSPHNLPLLARLQSLSIRFCDYQRVAGSFDALDDAFTRWITSYNRSSSDAYTHDMEHEPLLHLNIEYANTMGTFYDADTLTAQSFDNLIRSALRHHAPFEQMRVLRLDQAPSAEPHLPELARATPHLRTVVLHKCAAPGAVLNALLAVGSVSFGEDQDVLPELATVVLVKCVLTLGDAAKLSETIARLRLRLFVVRVQKEEGEDDGEWGEVERVLRQEGAEVDVRHMKPKPPVTVFPLKGPEYWYKRNAAPYEKCAGLRLRYLHVEYVMLIIFPFAVTNLYELRHGGMEGRWMRRGMGEKYRRDWREIRNMAPFISLYVTFYTTRHVLTLVSRCAD
ncbi:hypothetical protein LXA43DRAFT_1148699 [Ganoderma leucocontextum]|nr:hypothetical protein LXA43DRAFT_1148699 [Ganoderma leucocontextum]